MNGVIICSVQEKVNLGLGYGYSGGFTKYCRIPGEILAIHKRAIWEIPEGLEYEEAAVMDPICNAYKAIAQRSGLLRERMWLYSVQGLWASSPCR